MPGFRSSSSLSTRLRRWSVGLALAVAALGATVLAGWVLDLPLLRTTFPSVVPMKANAALCFLALGVAVALRRARPRAAEGLSLGVCAIAAAMVAEWLLGVELGIDQLLAPEPPGTPGTTVPGRIALHIATCLALLGGAVALLRRRPRAAQLLTLVAGADATLILMAGHQLRALYALPGFTPPALCTAIGVLVMAAAVLLAEPERGPTSLLVAEGAAGALARRALPVVLLAPLVLGLVARTELFDSASEDAAEAVLVTAAFLWLTVGLARRLARGPRWSAPPRRRRSPRARPGTARSSSTCRAAPRSTGSCRTRAAPRTAPAST